MELIGKSSLWVEKYRPKTVKDLILPTDIKNLFDNFVKDGDIPNLLFSSSAGRGKTSAGFSLIHDLKADKLFLNGSVSTSIDTLRYEVTQFANTSSFSDNGKICFIDECDRLSPQAQDAMKALIEQTESNCRFILTTNNMSQIIDQIKSRCQLIDFNFNQKEKKSMVVAYFKRVCWILDQEGVQYDKQILAEFVQQIYPDFRKTLNELQKFYKMFGKIDDAIFRNIDGAIFGNILEEIKNKKFNNVRKLVTQIDHSTFYTEFYSKLDEILVDKSKPTAIMILGRFVYEASLSIAPEISLCACITEIMRDCEFK
jgi:replication factor C small subunit